MSVVGRACIHRTYCLVWYILNCIVVNRLPCGSGELDCAVQRVCVHLLDTMYTLWRITEP